MTSSSDEKWRPFNCFFSQVGLRTYQHPCMYPRTDVPPAQFARTQHVSVSALSVFVSLTYQFEHLNSHYLVTRHVASFRNSTYTLSFARSKNNRISPSKLHQLLHDDVSVRVSKCLLFKLHRFFLSLVEDNKFTGRY